jgi:hypothetical protein
MIQTQPKPGAGHSRDAPRDVYMSYMRPNQEHNIVSLVGTLNFDKVEREILNFSDFEWVSLVGSGRLNWRKLLHSCPTQLAKGQLLQPCACKTTQRNGRPNRCEPPRSCGSGLPLEKRSCGALGSTLRQHS